MQLEVTKIDKRVYGSLRIVWRIRGKIISSVLCCVMCMAVVHTHMHAHEQFLKMSVGLGLAFCLVLFWFSLDYLCCLL